MGFDDHLADIETQSNPTMLTPSCRVDSIEALENMWQMLSADANAGVRHPETELLCVVATADCNLTANWCVLESVVNQVDQQLNESVFVGNHMDRFGIDRERHPEFFGQRTILLDYHVKYLGKIDNISAESDGPGIAPCQRQQCAGNAR